VIVDPELSDSATTQSKSELERAGHGHAFGRLAADYAVVLFFVALIVAFSIDLPHLFPTLNNMRAIMGGQAVVGVAALAVLFPLSAGEFDLSVGAVIGFTSVFSAWAGAHGIGFPLSLFLALGIGLAIGAFNAMLVVRVGISAFIATLGVATILMGANLWLTNGAVLYNDIPHDLQYFGQASLGGIPIIFWYFCAFALVVWVVLEHTPFGRYVQATGFAREAARLVGIRTDRYLASTFVIAAAMAAFAGVMQTGRVSSAAPSTGPEFLLPAYAAAFLGATTVHRGRFNTWGTVVGVLLLAVGVSGLNLLGAPFWITDVFNGAALLVAVSFAVVVSKRLAKEDSR
jgi:ribose transport system permease protein